MNDYNYMIEDVLEEENDNMLNACKMYIELHHPNK